jgi:hypothetical protein
VAVLLRLVDFTSHWVSSRASLRTVLHEQIQMNHWIEKAAEVDVYKLKTMHDRYVFHKKI